MQRPSDISRFSSVLATGRPLVSITGPTGIGRTAFLAELGETLSRRGARVWAIRFTRDGDAVPVSLPGSDSVLSSIGAAAGAHQDLDVARRAAAEVAALLLRGGGEAALLIDDAQWADHDSRAVLEALARRLAGTRAVCVCATRTPTSVAMRADHLAWVRGLRGEALLHSVRLWPMTAAEISRKLAAVTRAKPDAELVARVGELSRGVPAAVRDSMEMLRRNGSMHVVGGRAYLVPGQWPPDPPQDNEFVRVIRGLGPRAECAAKAVSVLAPLGEAVPRLVAEALGMTEPQAVALLESLRREGVLHRGRSWRFSVPLVASALIAGMGPFERRQLAAQAVTAVWAGDARCADPDDLTDLVAEAGRLVDPRRALDALLLRSAEAGEQGEQDEQRTERALRWLGAAIELTQDRAQRVKVMLMHSAACHRNGDHERGLRATRLLLNGFADQLAPDAAQEVQVMAVCALNGVGDTEALREIAEPRRHWPADPAQSVVTRAVAYSMLDRWGEARDLLAKTEQCWRAGDATSVMFGSLIQALAALWTGRGDQFERSLAGRAHWPLRDVRRHRVEQVHSHVTALLVTGDSSRAEKLLIDEDLPVESLRLGERAMVAAMRGAVDLAVDLARRGVANDTNRGHLAGSAAMYQSVIAGLVSQGRLTTAREMRSAARETDQRLGHLLDLGQAQIERALGEDERARAKLHDCLRAATERGLLIGLDTAWAELADLALRAGDRLEAMRCLAAIEHLAQTMPTSRVLALARLVRATVCGEQQAAGECLRLVRERGQPLELAVVMERLVRSGAGDPKLLIEAYEILGGLDALLYRSWLRHLMREHSIVVPGRAQTVAENERLLALLAADGLTNKQLASALRTSEKSVEGRLGRLFAHTGYRSRIELSNALLAGELRLE